MWRFNIYVQNVNETKKNTLHSHGTNDTIKEIIACKLFESKDWIKKGEKQEGDR